MEKPDIDAEKGGWILGGIVAVAGIVKSYISRTRPLVKGGSLNDNMALVYAQQEKMVERYRAEAESADKRAAECEKEREGLLDQIRELRSDVRLLQAQIADLKEEIEALKGES